MVWPSSLVMRLKLCKMQHQLFTSSPPSRSKPTMPLWSFCSFNLSLQQLDLWSDHPGPIAILPRILLSVKVQMLQTMIFAVTLLRREEESGSKLTIWTCMKETLMKQAFLSLKSWELGSLSWSIWCQYLWWSLRNSFKYSKETWCKTI